MQTEKPRYPVLGGGGVDGRNPGGAASDLGGGGVESQIAEHQKITAS